MTEARNSTFNIKINKLNNSDYIKDDDLITELKNDDYKQSEKKEEKQYKKFKERLEKRVDRDSNKHNDFETFLTKPFVYSYSKYKNRY